MSTYSIKLEFGHFPATYLIAWPVGQVRQYEGNDVEPPFTSGHFVIRFLAGVASHYDFIVMSRDRDRICIVFKPSVNGKRNR